MYAIMITEIKERGKTKMTQIEVAKKLFASLEKGTVLTKSKYQEISRNFYTRDNYKRIIECPSRWDLVIQDPERYGVERMEVFHKVPTSKVTTVDVLEMVKNGCTVEEIEKAIYTTVKEIRIIVK